MRQIILIDDQRKDRAKAAIDEADYGYVCTIKEATRNADQSAKFHAICDDIAKSGKAFAGHPRTADVWKLLLISGHAHVEGKGSDIIAGIEHEWVNIRESTAQMSRSRMSSLIEYATSWCMANDIILNDPKETGHG